MIEPLAAKEIEAWIKDYPRWNFAADTLKAEFKFKNFVEAFGFLTKVAILAEKQNHHPQIENMYNKVMLVLTTHDAGNKVTQKDIKLAQAIENLGNG